MHFYVRASRVSVRCKCVLGFQIDAKTGLPRPGKIRERIIFQSQGKVREFLSF